MTSLVRIQHPTTIMVSGPTGCGKTYFVVRLINSTLIQPPPQRMWWVYNFWQPLYEQLTGEITFVHASGAESASVVNRVLGEMKPEQRNLLVLDDQMSSLADSGELARLFTEGSHHLNLTVIYIVQNLFHHAKSQVTVSRNTHYFIIFKNPRDTSQVSSLMQQLARGKTGPMVKIFEDATEEPFSYLYIDCHPQYDKDLRYCVNIFPGEQLYRYEAV